jgi:hypothetical protein
LRDGESSTRQGPAGAFFGADRRRGDADLSRAVRRTGTDEADELKEVWMPPHEFVAHTDAFALLDQRRLVVQRRPELALGDVDVRCHRAYVL